MDRGGAEAAQMLVHNLKAPVTGIVAMLEMLADGDFGPLSDAQRTAVRDLLGYGAELQGLVDELLDTWRLESGAVPVNIAPVDVGDLLAQLRTEWSGRLAGRLTSEPAQGASLFVLADRVVLRRVLNNLLLNAITHGGAGVQVSTNAGALGDTVRLRVSDTGPGIPSEQAERVFEKFVRLDGAPRGSGLGLAYCRAACHAMGGRIAIEPSSSGTTFVVDLPRAEAT